MGGRAGYHLVDTVIIVIVIVITSRNLIAMRRSHRPLSRQRLTSTGHGPGTPPFIHMQLPVTGGIRVSRLNLLAVNRVGIRAIGPSEHPPGTTLLIYIAKTNVNALLKFLFLC